MSTPYTLRPFPPRRPRHPGPSLGRRHKKLSADKAANLCLASAGTGVPVTLIAESPAIMELAVEDLCWQLGVKEHAARQPAFWHRAERAAWKREIECWEFERACLADMARAAMTEL